MPITDIRLGIPIDNLKKLLPKTTENLETIRQEIRAGKDRWYQLRIRPFLSHDKKIKGAVLSLAEISEMKRLEDENASYTTDLEQRVNDQAGELLASERLASIGKTAGMVGHDIRNPLQSIVSELYVARQEIEAVPPCEMKENMLESIGCIEEQIFYINKIVSDLQDYARPAKPQFLEVDIQGTIDSVLSRIPISDSVRVCVDVESGLSKPFLDSSFLQRILTNLISNAVQAMPKGGDLVVSAGRLDGSLILKVADSGEGISKETKEKLFTPLFTTKSKGQGFGLAVVKRLTEAMGGEVSFESEVGKGTTFTIKFPKHSDI
jgi:signal transduction histidine kinase